MTSSFEIQKAKIRGVSVLKRLPLKDSRGFFERLYCARELSLLLNGKSIVQINHTMTKRSGTVRGLHFQHNPFAEIKVVNCVKGKVWDIALDLRKGSPTFLQYHAEILSDNNHKTIVIPEGVAHGFQALSNDCEMLYFHTKEYNSESEGALNVKDPQLNIQWPLNITDISDRDRSHSMINELFEGV
jgi:dTDP-4-dehydrorhamnose 3,5-epimerase